MCLDFGYRKERKEKKKWEFYLSLVCLQRELKRKNVCFYLCALINDKKIHILEEQSLIRLQPYLIK